MVIIKETKKQYVTPFCTRIIKEIEMTEKEQKPKADFLHMPFNLNSNGKIYPAEAALMMMVFDDIENPVNEEKIENFPSRTPYTTHTTINIDDMDIKGI